VDLIKTKKKRRRDKRDINRMVSNGREANAEKMTRGKTLVTCIKVVKGKEGT